MGTGRGRSRRHPRRQCGLPAEYWFEL